MIVVFPQIKVAIVMALHDSKVDKATKQAVKASLEGLHGLLTSDTASYRKVAFDNVAV